MTRRESGRAATPEVIAAEKGERACTAEPSTPKDSTGMLGLPREKRSAPLY